MASVVKSAKSTTGADRVNSITGKSRAETRAEARQKVGIRRVAVPTTSRRASSFIQY